MVRKISISIGELVRPVYADGQRYLDRVLSWIVVDEHVVLSHNNHYNNLRANMLCIPEEYSHPRSVFEELFAGFEGTMHGPEEVLHPLAMIVGCTLK